MNLPLQLFGFVDTPNGRAHAILTRDQDRPNEAMLQWYGTEIQAGGVLMEILSTSAKKFTLRPLRFYELDAGGGLFAPSHISNFAELMKYSAELSVQAAHLAGVWRNHLGELREISFALKTPELRVRAKKLKTWSDFKKWAGDQRRNGEYEDFRGHGSDQFALSSTLHRAGRARLERFCYETVPHFRGLAEANLDIRFKPGDADDFSVVLGLAQHHGLPTPLLDWTASPYVAAFFAFSDALENLQNRPKHKHVRIFALSREVAKHAPAHVTLTLPSPNISHLSISPRKNPRLLAQQGRFLLTNIANLESMLCSIEKDSGKKLITAVDIPIDCAAEALEDLYYMGLSGATMFPGLDGVCKMMKHQMAYRGPSAQAAPLPEPPTEQLRSSESQS
ncbi:FRG domain-containing protein [Massilia sp. SYSU DXS3249]